MNQNRHTNWLLFIFLAVLGVVFGFLLFHLGPSLHLARKEEVVASLRLKDGSLLVLAQKPNKGLVKAFTVRLYRLYPERRVEVTLVGFKESYWWRGRLKKMTDDFVDIQYLGMSACTYDVKYGEVASNDHSLPPQNADHANYDITLEKLRLQDKQIQP
jgi:hypothetical protein